MPNGHEPQLILFGGTFDPPHAGHAACLKGLCETFPKARILVMPAADPPPTATIRKKTWLSFDVRVELCQIIVAEMLANTKTSDSRIEVSTLEGTLPKPSYTVNTVEALLAAGKPDSRDQKKPRIAITIGTDQFQALDSWHRLDRLVEISDLIIVPRGSEPVKWPVGSTARCARFWSLNIKTPQVSSTAIREAIEQGRPLPKDWLSQGVLSRLQDLTGKAIQTADRKGTKS